MSSVFESTDTDIEKAFETAETNPGEPAVATVAAPAATPSANPAPAGAPPVAEPIAATAAAAPQAAATPPPTPAAEVVATLADIVQLLGPDDIVEVKGKKIKAQDIRTAIEDHQNKKRWQEAQGERDRQLGEERKRIEKFVPLIDKLETDPDFATVIGRAEQYYDHPELRPSRKASAPTEIAPEADELNLAGESSEEGAVKLPPVIATMQRDLETIKNNQLLMAKREELLKEKQGREQLTLLKQEVAAYAKDQKIPWDADKEKRFLGYVAALTQASNDPDEKIAQEAFFLVTRTYREAQVAANAADKAIEEQRRALPSPPPTISGGGTPPAQLSLSQKDVEVLEALGIPSDRWPALAGA